MTYKKSDVLVIGAGLSGLIAAAKAVEQGHKVLLLATGMGALSLSSGCIDLWGYRLDRPNEVCQNPMDEIFKMVKVNSEHPYAKVQDVLEESLNFFLQVCSNNHYPYLDNKGSNWLLPTALGTVRPTYLAPVSMAVDSLANAKKILVVGFQGLKDFYPEVLVTNLKRSGQLNSDCLINTTLVSVGGNELNPNNLAHRLEQPEILNELINQVKPHLSTGSIILFPPVLGECRDSKVTQNLADNLDCPVYEVTNIPPTLPGQRLHQALMHHLKTQGVEVIIGCNVTGADISDKKCLQVTATSCGNTMQVSAQHFILATGSFLGGGLKARPKKVLEAIFNLPVKTTTENWSNQQFLGMEGHPFNEFGIVVNDHLQPVDNQGQTIIDNLMIVGANLAGCNYPIEKCGNGVAVATGYKAGKLLAEVER